MQLPDKLRPYFTPSTLILIGTNLFPIYGVLFEGWKIFDIMVLFWLENVIIGLFNIVKILALLPLKKDFSAILLAPVFSLHYGGFCFVHGIFVIALFGQDHTAHFNDMPSYVLSLLKPDLLLYPALALIGSHLFSLIANFLIGGEYKNLNCTELMGQPYSRIVVLHFVLLIGGGLALATGSNILALVLLIFLKICIDLRMHTKEHQKLTEPKGS